jgi:hypothetical protein
MRPEAGKTMSWQAEAPAPPARNSFASKVGQTLSSADPPVSAIISHPPVLLTLSVRNFAENKHFTHVLLSDERQNK